MKNSIFLNIQVLLAAFAALRDIFLSPRRKERKENKVLSVKHLGLRRKA
jgi:hypothetical protein